MYTIKTLNAISPVGLAKLNNKQFDVAVDTDAPDGILVRSADMLNTAFNDNLLAIARAGAGVNNIPLERCSEQGIVVFLSLIHISEPTRRTPISYAVFCLKKK